MTLTVSGCMRIPGIPLRKSADRIVDTAFRPKVNLSDTVAIGSYAEPKYLGALYVSNLRGADCKRRPDERSKTMGHFYYGHFVPVYAAAGGWYAVWPDSGNEDPYDKYFSPYYHESSNGNEIESEVESEEEGNSGTDKLYYIKKEDLGPASAIKLDSFDLAAARSFSVWMEPESKAKGTSEEGNISEISIRDFMDFTLVDQKTFMEEKAKSSFYYLSDTADKKKDHVIELKTRKGSRKLFERLNQDEENAQYSYVGQYAALNKYIIAFTGYEDYGYLLVDKDTGRMD
jgi:hypothetical protein